MALTSGTHLGPYEITAQIGVGGMGEVYKATDTNLKRAVAIKVLPASVAGDPDRLARFQREAEVLAALNHPNIAQIHGLEKSDATIALVMELVEGPTLADRIAQGAIPIDEALPIAKQIAEALEAAHEQGIVHRDLKPANIKVRADGTVKVLDFGLAKAMEPAGGARADATNSPTLSMQATMAGVILGTAAYMSPEQARGKAVDKRADIWAFGCVLYEMLTGTRAFEGEDIADTLGNVMKVEPSWHRVPPSVPARVVQVMRACLQKNPKQRIDSAQDVRLALEGAFETAGPQAAAPVTVPPWRRIATLTTGALAIAVATGGAVWYAMRQAAPRVIRTTITTAGATALRMRGYDRDLAVTPDGTRVVYRGLGQILVRGLEQLDPTPLNGLGSPQGLFVSPDGQWVGFFDGTLLLKKVAITGGPAVMVSTVDGGGPEGATWGEDDTIVFGTSSLATGLQRVSAAGGTPAVLTKPNSARGEGDHLWPEFLPGAQAVLFTITPANGSMDNAQIAVLDLRSGTQKVLVRGGSHAHYVPSGHLVYGVAGTLRAVGFDLDRLEVTGIPAPVVPQVVTSDVGAANFDVARNGTLVYVPGDVTTPVQRTLLWVDREGRETPLKAPDRRYVYPRLSPDGTRVALSIDDQQRDIWVWDLRRDTLSRITFDPGLDQYPAWMPDGRSLLLGAGLAGASSVFRAAADGTGSPERLTENTGDNSVPYSVSPDGNRVVIRQGGTSSSLDLAVLLLGRVRRTEPLIRTPFREVNAEISPDGRWLAYESNESGRREVYVRPFPNVADGRWQVSNGGGTRPGWARSGRELFYLAVSGSEATLMAVKVESGTTWAAGNPAKLFSGRFFFVDALGAIGEGRTYDVAADGRRFLMVKERGEDSATAAPPIIVVQNWFEELKRLVPTK